MRWIFLLLAMLNAFYYVWHQQEMPLTPKEASPLSLYKGAQQDIRLLNEDGVDLSEVRSRLNSTQCLYLGGDMPESEVRAIQQRLTSLDIQTRFSKLMGDSIAGYWLKIAPGSSRLLDELLLKALKQDFPLLKNEIISCAGIATAE
ncbi:hypothetical protein [Pseudomonas sp. LP_7_YM]|uniref:hypothetical protein n=1 Tax=Pseudomonas sp. LP_7_YM TaxID=2485137 RepID=UPI00105F286A|nr:hypothetical protein [Pseudomonas sp. LP_7_YM]TDV59308.1 hypothetical protein EC915_11864 [Pseudomonas sp. LP_7_YM]